MDEQKLTDWFPPEVLPARAGWYLREYTSGEVSWMNSDPDGWDGEHWYYGDGEGGYDPRPETGPPNLRWRGLAEPPLTDWLDPDTPPEREGVYEIEPTKDEGGQRLFACWSPSFGWGQTCGTSGGTMVSTAIQAACGFWNQKGIVARHRRWRGLAVQP